MRKLVLVAVALCFVTSLAFAQQKAPAAKPAPKAAPAADEYIAMKGDIIDNMCANANKGDLAKFVKKHTKECALSDDCFRSGYALFSDGKLYKFDQESNNKVNGFLTKSDSKLQVVVQVKKVGDKISLHGIQNQK